MPRLFLGTPSRKKAHQLVLEDVSRAGQGAWGVPAGTGVLHNTPLNEGGNWLVSGPGQNFVVRDPAGYAHNPDSNPANQNAYVFVAASGRVRRYVMAWSGAAGKFATMAISTGAGSLQNMLHINMGANANAVIAKQVNGTGIVGVVYGGAVSPIPAVDDGGLHYFALEVVGDKIFVYVDGLLRTWGQDPVIATWGDSLQHCMGQIHGSDERIYGMWTYTDVEIRPDLLNTAPIAEIVHQRAPVQTPSVLVAPAGTNQLADVDIVTGEQRDQVFRSAFALTQHYRAGTGYSVRQVYGNGGYQPGGDESTRFEWSTSILGFMWTVADTTLMQVPHWAFGTGVHFPLGIALGEAGDPVPRVFPVDDSPEGSVSAVQGSLAVGAGGVWRKSTSSGNTGWRRLSEITVGNTAPSSPSVNDLWVDTN